MGAHQIPTTQSATGLNMAFATKPFDWRRCRSIGFKFGFWIWPWKVAAFNANDQYGGVAILSIGPFDFEIHYALSEKEAEKLSRWWSS